MAVRRAVDAAAVGGGGGGGGDGMEVLWRAMFTDAEGIPQLQPGGRYYTEAARSLGLTSGGRLNPRMLYSFPNPLLQYTAKDGADGDDSATLNFTYDAAQDRLVYLHAGSSDAEADAGAGLERSTSVELQGEAQRVWQRRDFLRPDCLRPGGLLYMNAVDSFGCDSNVDLQ